MVKQNIDGYCLSFQNSFPEREYIYSVDNNTGAVLKINGPKLKEGLFECDCIAHIPKDSYGNIPVIEAVYKMNDSFFFVRKDYLEIIKYDSTQNKFSVYDGGIDLSEADFVCGKAFGFRGKMILFPKYLKHSIYVYDCHSGKNHKISLSELPKQFKDKQSYGWVNVGNDFFFFAKDSGLLVKFDPKTCKVTHKNLTETIMNLFSVNSTLWGEINKKICILDQSGIVKKVCDINRLNPQASEMKLSHICEDESGIYYISACESKVFFWNASERKYETIEYECRLQNEGVLLYRADENLGGMHVFFPRKADRIMTLSKEKGIAFIDTSMANPQVAKIIMEAMGGVKEKNGVFGPGDFLRLVKSM